MIKNGKYFLPPPKEDCDIKELLKIIAASGAGRPIGNDGFPAGQWTAELLSDAISQVNPKRQGADLRTVQLWFQDNDKGIGPSNIHWLARILGCDNPELTSAWQIELAAAQSRLMAKRRGVKHAGTSRTATIGDAGEEAVPVARKGTSDDGGLRGPSFSLATTSEAIFTRGSPLDLPAAVFAGATALGFLSFMIGIHNVTYSRADGLTKQVGFFWAPNWTILFMAILPLFFVFVIELLAFWRRDGRLKVTNVTDQLQSDEIWLQHVRSFSRSFWAVFVICVFVAGLAQWIGVSVIPLSSNSRDYAIDWGKVALVRPEIVSVTATLVFTGLAYLYMSFCFYLFFSGLILLLTVIHDLRKSAQAARVSDNREIEHKVDLISLRVMRGVFRCTVLGISIAICMKMQSAYLVSNGKNIADWMVGDAYSAFFTVPHASRVFAYRMPTHYSSLLIAVSSCVVFVYGAARIGVEGSSRLATWNMAIAVALLFCGYVAIDAFAGFTIFLVFCVLPAAYGMVDPGMRSLAGRAGQGT